MDETCVEGAACAAVTPYAWSTGKGVCGEQRDRSTYYGSHGTYATVYDEDYTTYHDVTPYVWCYTWQYGKDGADSARLAVFTHHYKEALGLLEAFAGGSMPLRCAFTSDGSVHNDGRFVDDVRVT